MTSVKKYKVTACTNYMQFILPRTLYIIQYYVPDPRIRGLPASRHFTNNPKIAGVPGSPGKTENIVIYRRYLISRAGRVSLCVSGRWRDMMIPSPAPTKQHRLSPPSRFV